jgi:transposase-like protein
MALFKYLKKTATDCPLPDPEGPLSIRVPSSAIKTANQEVVTVIQEEGSRKKKRGPYKNYTAKEKAKVAKRAVECGVTSTVRYFAAEFADGPLNEATVRVWVKQYKQEVSLRKKGNKSMEISALESKKRGRPLLLGEELDKRVQLYVSSLRGHGAVINTRIVMAAAEGIVKSYDSNLLRINGGHIACDKHWAKHFYTAWVMSNGGQILSVSDFEACKSQFLFDIATITEMEDIPNVLILNWDHTGIKYVPVGNWTMAKEGSKRVDIVGMDDKRQITAVFGCTMEGEFLPPQIIYGGKTVRCLPSVKFPDSWGITYSPNHWANEETTKSYIQNILVPFIKQKRCSLHLSPQYPALVLFDRFKGQCTPNVLSILNKNNILFVVVPANCTDRLQPLDVSVNKAAKECLRRQFQQWYSERVCKLLEEKKEASVNFVHVCGQATECELADRCL